MEAHMNTRDTFSQAIREWRESGRPFNADRILARWESLDREARPEATSRPKGK
jgi:hypothetical protein